MSTGMGWILGVAGYLVGCGLAGAVIGLVIYGIVAAGKLVLG